MISALLTGIYGKCTSSTALYADIGGRLYSNRAPQGAQYPYVVFSLVSSVSDWSFDDAFEDAQVQFNIFSQNTSAAEAGTILSDLIALYDDCALSVTGYSALYMHRDLIIPNNDMDEDPPIHGYTVQYNIELLKT